MRHATTKSQVKGNGAWSGAIVFFNRGEEGRFMRQSGTMLTALRRKIVAALVVGALLAAGGWVFAQDKPAAPAASAASAAAPAPPPPSKPDPAGTATGGIADVAAKIAGKPTLADLRQFVGHTRVSLHRMSPVLPGLPVR